MSEELVVEGIVIKNIQYRDYDGIITCISEKGLITFLANGILKLQSKNASSCLLYSKSEFTLEKKNEKLFLTKGKLINSNFKLYESLDNMCCLGIVSECILNFLDDPGEIIYNSLSKMLEGLNQGFDVFTLCAICLSKIIQQSGYGLEISHCVKCGSKTKIVSLDYAEGGFICQKCVKSINEVDKIEYLKSVRYTFMVDIDNFFHFTLNKTIAIRLIKEYVSYLLDQFGYKKMGFFELFNQSY